MRVFRIEGDRLRELAWYGDFSQTSHNAVIPTLVRNVRGDALGLWMKAAHWYVFPIDLRTGRVDAPLEIPAHRLARMPAACRGEDGWLLEGQLSVSPHMDLDGAVEGLRLGTVEAQVVASDAGLCVDSLAALAASPVPGHLQPELRAGTSATRAVGVPLIVTDRRPTGRRWELSCTR